MGMTEDEMVGWHHKLDIHEFEQAPGDLPDPGIKLATSAVSPALQADSLPLSHWESQLS